MQPVYFVIYVAALVLFALATSPKITRYNLMAAGLFFLTLALVIQVGNKLF